MIYLIRFDLIPLHLQLDNVLLCAVHVALWEFGS